MCTQNSVLFYFLLKQKMKKQKKKRIQTKIGHEQE